MQQYVNTVQNRSGSAVAGASVLVKTHPGAVEATIYSDDGVTVATNPLTTDANGEFTFYAADGRYSLTISKTGVIQQRTVSDILLQDPDDGTAEQDAADVHFAQSGTAPTARTVQDVERAVVRDGDFASSTNYDSRLAALTEVLGVYGIDVVGDLKIGVASSSLVFNETAGLNGKRIRLAPRNQSTSSNSSALELVPGDSVAHASTTPSQIILYSVTGTDYERFAFSCTADQFIIDSSANNSGTPRDIKIQVGGRVDPTPISGRNAIIAYADASVDIHASNYSADGKTWGATRCRFTDPGNAGDTRATLDTRTGTPADNAADTCSVTYARGGTAKWNVGLNYAGGNVDSFDFYSGALRFQLTTGGNIICGSAAIATNATDGFLYVPSCAGTPTGTPTSYTGRIPIVVDSTNHKLYFYSGSAWRDAGP